MFGIADTLPHAGEAEWRRLVERVLGGRPFESLVSTTFEGLKIAPLYQRPTNESARVLRQKPGAWTISQRMDHPEPETRHQMPCREAELFDLGFLEFDVLADDRIVFLERQLFRLGAGVFLGHIEIARVRRRQKLDLDHCGLRHFVVPLMRRQARGAKPRRVEKAATTDPIVYIRAGAAAQCR